MLEPLAAPVLLELSTPHSHPLAIPHHELFPDPHIPAYTSLVLVHKSSRYHAFKDLHDAILAYNDVYSLSGFHCVRFHVAELQLQEPFFRSCIRTGGHLNSVQALVDGLADAAAIDISVIRALITEGSPLLDDLRVLEDTPSLGPNTSQPFVAPLWLAENTRRELRDALCSAPKELLATFGWKEIVPVDASHYAQTRDHIQRCAGRPVVAITDAELELLLDDKVMN